ncbi:MAG: LuxR C-terminal-related transcriptional regulator [Candidatus Bathyarchaeia archaeon]|jgi:DNA-binding NarL/FixJ family response regulator
MNLTERERIILQLAKQGLSDYRIARKINTDPPSVTRSRKNAQKKLLKAAIDLEWAQKTGLNLAELNTGLINSPHNGYNFFL